MGRHFAPALISFLMLSKVQSKCLILINAIKTLIGPQCLIGRILVFGDVNLQKLVPQETIFMVDLFLSLSPFSLLVDELIV
jgi:hypothetical protein